MLPKRLSICRTTHHVVAAVLEIGSRLTTQQTTLTHGVIKTQPAQSHPSTSSSAVLEVRLRLSTTHTSRSLVNLLGSLQLIPTSITGVLKLGNIGVVLIRKSRSKSLSPHLPLSLSLVVLVVH